MSISFRPNSTFLFPPASHDLRPERPDRIQPFLERLLHDVSGLKLFAARRLRHLSSIAHQVDALSRDYAEASDRRLREAVTELRLQLHRKGMTPPLVARSFALIRETADRILGQRHYPNQVLGGYALLSNTIAEMDTGEGKTLTATLAAATAALAGIPVHIISVNDYLTARDAESMGPLYRALGLHVGCVTQGMLPEQRRAAYSCSITYVTNKEIVFDYLRDRLTLGDRIEPLRSFAEDLYSPGNRTKKLLLRGLHFALVDEADSILIDEARTPLIISGPSDENEEAEFLHQALAVAGELADKTSFQIDLTSRQVILTEQGRKAILKKTEHLGPLWQGLVWREGMVSQALSALHLFHRDEQYLVHDGKIEIIDEFTGRVMPDRSWEQGLHQLIEVKENCEISQGRKTLAKISYQRFFRRYLQLAGMTGTAREVRGEIWSVYGLPTICIPTHRPTRRKHLPIHITPTIDDKWREVVKRAGQLHGEGRAVLIGTRSVAASEELSRLISAAGLAHRVLNAKHNQTEAEIIARAGETGTITIATNMAGRGTDIKLGPGVKERGGLHVILTERHEAARIDRQLAGRCGRQGDPGSFEEIISLEDSLLTEAQTGRWAQLAQNFPSQRLARWVINKAQKNIETYHNRMRKELFRQDQQQGNLLSFSGRTE